MSGLRTLGKAFTILLTKKYISTEKALQLKKIQSLRNGTELSEPYIQHFMQNRIYLFYKLSTLWNSEAIKDIPGTG